VVAGACEGKEAAVGVQTDRDGRGGLIARAAPSASLSPEVRALQTMEKILAVLRHDFDGDESLARLAAAIERDRAELLAAVIGSQTVSRLPPRVRNPVRDS
jgi:3-methyladenine DNA glycosylase/8-oxoguanine DNA glycosylase